VEAGEFSRCVVGGTTEVEVKLVSLGDGAMDGAHRKHAHWGQTGPGAKGQAARGKGKGGVYPQLEFTRRSGPPIRISGVVGLRLGFAAVASGTVLLGLAAAMSGTLLGMRAWASEGEAKVMAASRRSSGSAAGWGRLRVASFVSW